MVNFSYVIFYVKNIDNTLSFYQKAFGLIPKFVDESKQYTELNTGATALAFVTADLAHKNLPQGYMPHDVKKPPLACEIVFTVKDVQEAYDTALKAGASAVASPLQKPWGQMIAYVRDLDGILFEIASAMS